MDNYKVAILSHEFPPFLIGGIASHCFNLAQSLSKNKVYTTVICGLSKKVTLERLNPYLEVIRLPFFNFPPRFFWFQLQNISFLCNILKKVDILHGVNPLASALCVYFAKKLKKPSIVSIHEVYLSDLKVFVDAPFSEWTFGDFVIHGLAYPINELFTRTCLNNSNHIIVCGKSAFHDIKKNYPKIGDDKISVIYNGINLDEFDNHKIGEQLTEQNLTIVYHGRLVWRKGILYLIKAIALLLRDFPEISLKIYGRGPLEKKLKTKVKKLGLNNNVSFEGHVPRSKLIEGIIKSSIAVLPSLYEVGPFISALEVMACKKPLITFDYPFTREFVLNMYNGILAKPKNVEDLANKIRMVLLDSKLRKKLGQNAYNYVKNKHNWDLLVNKYLRIYEGCLR